ncbi:MAG: anaerobic ribonucleoside-triphosphate reductase activating protein [Clostridia bacterium]|nr:anaerobic ribonucleoside-triphosphate reductase activating protein [Clostridia bacterium]
MHYATIKPYDIANGPGVRVSLFVSGCTHHCPGCFNKETWDFSFGELFTETVEAELLAKLSSDYINGLTLLGGEPMEPANQRALLPFVREVRARYPEKSIWCYSGYTYEKDLLAPDGRAHCEATEELLSLFDVLVDGRYIEALYDITLLFRGSSNQRLIDLRRTEEAGSVVLWEKQI